MTSKHYQDLLFYSSHLLDVDECSRNTDNCHENADCLNNPGSYTCHCKPGFTGNGTSCSGKQPSIKYFTGCLIYFSLLHSCLS